MRSIWPIRQDQALLGQSAPFTNDGTVRWENLQTHQSHFFFEQAMGQSADTKDTLQVQRVAAQGVGSTGAIVPFRQGPFITGTDTSFYSVVVKVPLLDPVVVVAPIRSRTNTAAKAEQIQLYWIVK